MKVLKIVGDKGTKVLQGEEVRTALRLKSTRFSVTKGADGSFVLQGLGFGHGLGMSQWGAYNLAQQGVNHLTNFRTLLPRCSPNTNSGEVIGTGAWGMGTGDWGLYYFSYSSLPSPPLLPTPHSLFQAAFAIQRQFVQNVQLLVRVSQFRWSRLNLLANDFFCCKLMGVVNFLL